LPEIEAAGRVLATSPGKPKKKQNKSAVFGFLGEVASTRHTRNFRAKTLGTESEEKSLPKRRETSGGARQRRGSSLSAAVRLGPIFLPSVLGPTRMMRCSFGAMCLAAARPFQKGSFGEVALPQKFGPRTSWTFAQGVVGDKFDYSKPCARTV